jgi:hypothetical protein
MRSNAGHLAGRTNSSRVRYPTEDTSPVPVVCILVLSGKPRTPLPKRWTSTFLMRLKYIDSLIPASRRYAKMMQNYKSTSLQLHAFDNAISNGVERTPVPSPAYSSLMDPCHHPSDELNACETRITNFTILDALAHYPETPR